MSISYAFGQENCTNGVDDDGDGYIDCYDGDCAGGASCSEFYFGNSVLCAEEPTENPTFAIRTEWVSADETANSHALPAIGDIDQDGTPEVVVTNRQARTVSVLDGVTGQTEFQIGLYFEPENSIVLANLENDDCAEMIIVENVGNDIIVYDCNQVEKWRGTSSRNNIGLPAVADFDGDGNVELYYKNEIRNALTGAILVTGSGNWDKDFVHSPIAVDVFGDSDLELITGDDIWSVDLAAGTLTRVADMDTDLAASGYSGSYHPKYYSSWDDQWSAISVADFNLDGNIDVLTSGALGSGYWSTTSVFFWDIANGEVKVYQDAGNNFVRGTGRINIGDTDGDGFLNATYVSDQVLYSLHINPVTGVFEPLWTKAVKEGSSGFTGCSLFDFDGDGAFETIYRSESALLIIDGTDGSTRKTLPCISRTQEEYPIVADIDGDGASEICVSCYTSDATPFNPYANTQYSHIRVFGADGEAWQPSRSVWNQHAYFNVNINDDLTVPLSQQDHTAVFSTDICTTGPNRFLNTFLNQSPFVDETGCPSYVSPDIDLDGTSITATASNCPATEFSVSFDISNTGDADISGSLPVTFYAGDPLTANSTKLNTEIVVLLNFVEGETRTITLDVDGIGGDFDLYISVNDFGQTPPITPYSASIPECETDNNIASVSVTHTPFTLTVDKLKDNQKCDPSKPDNGQAQAYFDGTIGGGVETVWFEDFNDPDLNGDKNDTSGDSQWSSSAAGSPTFYGVNNSGFRVWNSGGNNEDKPVTWLSEVIDISDHTDVTFSADMISEGDMEASGKSRDVMRVYYKRNTDADFVLLSEGYGDFEYKQATVSGINANTLQIKVTMHTTANDEKFTLDNVSVTGTSGPTTKKFTDVDGFEFYWYNQGDFSTVLFSGSTYPTMADGNYSVVGYTVDGNCYSDTVNLTIDLDDVPDFEVHVYELSPLTDCADPDGELRAFAYTQTDGSGDPLDTLEVGYSFTWTLSSDAGGTTIGAGSILSNLEAIGYFVEVEYTLSGCVMTGSEVVSSSLSQPPVPDVSLTHITTCGGTGAASASIGGNTSNYDFQWYVGSTLKPTPDYTTAAISSLAAGNYTVRAIEKASSCPGDPVTVTINDNSTGPQPVVTINQHNTSCETGASNGSASADGDGAGTTSGYTFTWYVGTTTANANKLPGAVPGSSVSGATASGLPDGIYSVTVKKGGCTVKRTFEILEQSSAPEFNFITSVDAGSAINFSNKSWIEIPQAIAGWKEITISYWVYLANENYLNDHLIFSSGGTGEDQVVLWTDNTDGLAFVVKTQGDGSRGRINTNYKPTGWTQLTGVWSALTDLNGDGNLGDMAIYADGVLLGTDNYLGNGNGLLNAGTEMYVARDRNLGTNKFEGRFDELRVFNKAFTPLEINEAVCAETVGTETGLIVYYDFDGLSDVSDGASIPNRATGVNSNVNVNTGQSGAFYNGTVQLQAQGTIAYVTSDINCPLGYAQNNTTCDPANPNGSMDLTGKVDPDGGNYEYILYDGYSTDTELSTITSPSSPVFTGLSAGFYTIEVIDLDTDCSTGTLAFAIADIVDEPSIITSITNDSGCNATGTGQIFVQAYSDNSEPSSYTFELFDGATLDPGSSLGTTSVANGNTGFTYTDLTDGTYRILVTNDDILCDFYKDVIISDVSTTPTISSITAINNVYCSSNSGFLNVNMPSGTDGDYTYTFYAGETTSAPLIVADTVSDVLNGLAGGKYTVVAKSKLTGCETAPQTKTIIDDPAYPNVVTSEVTPATGCNATAGGGSIEAYVQDPDNPGITYIEPDYSFQWYLGSVAPGNEVAASNDGDQSTATNLPSATYYVVVTDTETGCVTSTANITLSQTPVKPVLTINTLTPNTTCDPTGTTGPTGGVSVNVSFNGSAVVDPDASGYTFTWYEGSGTSGQNITVDGTSNGSTPSGESTSSISNITNMTYTVVAVGPNGCSSDPIQGVVAYSPANPQINTVSVSNNTVCDVAVAGNYDGEIVVSPVTGVVSDYEFLWYEGVGTGGTQVTNTTTSDDVINEASAYNLEGSPTGKKYTLEMTNLGNGCVNEFSFEIKDVPAQPIIVLSESEVRNNTTCSDSPNGSIVAAIDLNNAVVNGRANDEVFQNISSCNTSVLDNATEVGANGFQLTTETNNQFGRIWLGDSIDLAKPLRLDFRILLGSRDANGADGIAFTMHRDPRGYDARGRVGGDLGVGQVLGGGSFNKIEPAVTIEFDTWDNGSSDPSYDHTNLFFNGNITTTELGIGMGSLPQIHASKTNVEDGDTLDVSILVTQSGSDQVIELWVEGSLRFIYTGDVINNVFGGESKVIGGFTSSTGGSVNNQAVFLEPVLGEYDFAWTDNLGNSIGGNVPFICGVGPGDYTLTVTNSSTGCVSDTETFTVEDELTAIDAELTVTQQPTACSGGTPDGILTAVINNDDGGDYSFKFYAGSGVGADGTELNGIDTLNPVLNGRAAGIYTVKVTDLQDPDGSCYAIDEVNLLVNKPVVALSGTAYGVTDCGTLSNGSYKINSLTEDGIPGNIGDYEFDVYDGDGDFVNTYTTDSITNLTEGGYSIIPVNPSTNCEFSGHNINIGDAIVLPSATLNPIGAGSETTNNTVCDTTYVTSGNSYNGAIEITPDAGVAADYTFTWFYGASTNAGDALLTQLPNAVVDSDTIIRNIPGGTYTLIMQNNANACADTLEFDILSTPAANPIIDNTTPGVDYIVSDVTACNADNGSIQILEVD
ncbi:LamG-like jellyroll fold domain-containing protein, partial [Marinoscillum luteum]